MKTVRFLTAIILIMTMLFAFSAVSHAEGSDIIITEDTTMSGFTLENQNLIVDEGVTLTMSGTIYVKGDAVITGGGTIKRSSLNGYLVNVSGDADLTLKHITLDGNDVGSLYSGIEIGNNSKVTMNEGTTLKNFKKVTTQGGAVEILTGGKFVMNGGLIYNNCATSYGGAAYIAQGGEFVLNNGHIDSNFTTKVDSEYGGGAIYNNGKFTMYGGYLSNNISTYRGGAIYNSSYGICDINGGTIESTNKATPKEGENSAGDGIFVSALEMDTAELQISGDAQINSGIYLYNGKTLLITDELHYDVFIVPEVYTEDVVVVAGLDYTLTQSDVAKLIIHPNGGERWYAELDEATNTIRVTKTEPSYKIKKVYVDGVNGSDENDGKTEATAVKTFQMAKDLVAADGEIVISDTITITRESADWGFAEAAYGDIVVKCNSDGKNVIVVAEGAELDLGVITIVDDDHSNDPDGENGATVYVRSGGNFSKNDTYTRLSGSIVYEKVTPQINMSMKTDSGTFLDETGMIRFLTTLDSANVPVHKVGTYIIPLALFESDFDQKADVVLERNIDVGDTFYADLMDIPAAAFDDEMYAISYVIVDGEVITSGSATATVNTEKVVGESYESLMEGVN